MNAHTNAKPRTVRRNRMRTITLLLTDYLISKSKLQAAFCEMHGLTLLDFGAEFGKLVESKDALASEIKEYYAAGQLPPDVVYEKLIAKKLLEYRAEDVLLYGYPRDRDQFQGLLTVLSSLHYQLKSICYVKHRCQDAFILDYLTDPAQKSWIDKYGLNPAVVQKWRDESSKRRSQIEGIKETAGSTHWCCLEVDYKRNLAKDDILLLIGKCA